MRGPVARRGPSIAGAPARALLAALVLAGAVAPLRAAAQLPVATTANDFRAPGTQPLTIVHDIPTPDACTSCHANYGAPEAEPFRNWSGSMMGQTGRDPLSWAAIAVANQDAEHSGETCLRCHLPKGWLEGRSAAADGTLMTAADRHGVQCGVCHRFVDPQAGPGAPAEDADILAALDEPVPAPGNAMMVVDPLDRRRGPFNVVADLGSDPHGPTSSTLLSPYHKSAELCGTCHNLRNPVFTRNPSTGAYELNPLDTPADPTQGFPEQVTYDEWAASEYASSGVHAPQFGRNQAMVSTCQDCHMPRITGRDASTGLLRNDLPLHEFAGANTFALTIIPHHPVFGPEVDPTALAAGVERATDMLRRAASLTLSLEDGELRVRVTNQSGHKLPTGYPEGRRMWLEVRAFDKQRRVLFESGRYTFDTATLSDDPYLHVWETQHGIDEPLAAQLGLAAGKSFHLVLNNVILKDNRIPPRGFTNAGFAGFGGEPVGASYADGQYWDDVSYPVGRDAAAAEVTLWYQTASREYVEFLLAENVTNAAGEFLHDLWEQHGKSEPVAMVRGYVARKRGIAERCRKTVARLQKRYRKQHLREWQRCFDTRVEGMSCDTAARDAGVAEAEAALRSGLSGAADKACAGANLAPSSLGHGTSCPVPCASITLYDFGDLADCSLCLADALDDATLESAYGSRPPALPHSVPASARACQDRVAHTATRLASDWTAALARCEKKNAKRKGGSAADCAQDPALARSAEKARRNLGRCDDLGALAGCGEVGDADGTLACLEASLEEPAAGYVGATWP
jgi:hypothetical protein